MNQARNFLGVAVVGEKLYAIGGRGSSGVAMSSVECLDLADPTSKWTFVAPMNAARAWFGTAVGGGRIYAIRGQMPNTFQSYMRMVECFDPRKGPMGRWDVALTKVDFHEMAGVTSVAGS